MESHFIDIDLVIKLDNRPWVVSKENPNIPIMKIMPWQFNLFKSGIYKNQGNKISFNGKDFYLPNDFMNEIKIQSKVRKIDISKLAISLQEFTNTDVVENLEVIIDLNPFKNILNTDSHIFMLCSKNKKGVYEKHIQKLNNELEALGLKIRKYYYISETFYNKDEDLISYQKVKILLQHLIGLKTDKDKFINQEIENYTKIYFYDDNIKTIELSKDVNSILENLLINTDDVVKLTIKDRIKNKENLIISKFWTNNKSNKWIDNITTLEYHNVVNKFKNFRRE